MNLAQPWALALGALALPVLFAYLHRLHKLRRPIGSTILMRAIRDEQPASRRSRSRLRHKLSLALMLLALLAAIIALADPATSAGRSRRVIVVLDTSASMATRDGGSDRLTHAAATVADLAGGLGRQDELALIATGADATVVAAPTRNHADVVVRATALAHRGAAGDNRADPLAFRLAEGLCRDPKHTTVVVVSDGAGLTVPRIACPIQHVAVGHSADNVGIAALSVRTVDGLGLHDVHVAVASTSALPRKVDVSLASDGEVVDVIGLDVPPHGDADRTIRVAIDHGKTLSATIPGGDSLALDDQATVGLSGEGPVQVLLVTSRARSMVAEVLRLHPRVVLTVAAPGALPPDRQDLIVLENEPGGELPPAPKVVAFGLSPNDAPVSLGAVATDRAILRWDYEAPWFRYVDLHDVVVAASRQVVGGHAVVETGSGALVATTPWGDRELIVTGFAIDETDLTLRAAFPNLAANLIDWAAPAHSATPPEGVLSASESHVTPVALPGSATAASSTGFHASRSLALIAMLLAIGLLLAEQLINLRLRWRST